ncbi:MAG: SDR family NAD(P)-dependent oxidoreductase [Dermatophilaceae bacterium]
MLVNNAGYGLVAPLEEVTDAELRAQFDTNVFGLMAVTRAFLPQLRARGAARIVNVSSIGGRLTMPFFGAYNATKYAVESLSDALRIGASTLRHRRLAGRARPHPQRLRGAGHGSVLAQRVARLAVRARLRARGRDQRADRVDGRRAGAQRRGPSRTQRSPAVPAPATSCPAASR